MRTLNPGLMLVLASALTLSACGGSSADTANPVGSGPTTPVPTDPGTPNPCTAEPCLDPLTFHGKAAEPNAAVVIHVGDKEFSGETNNEGVFEVELSELDADDFVRIVVTGAGGRSHVELVRLAGEFESLEELAGEDRILDLSETPRLHVNEMSTAFAGALNASMPADFALDADNLAVAERDFLDGQWVLYGATAMRRALDDAGLVPEGSTIFELVQDYQWVKSVAQNEAGGPEIPKSAAHKLLEEEDDGLTSNFRVFFDLAGELINDPAQTVPFSTGDMPSEYLLGTINRSYEINTGKILRLNSDGTGTISAAVRTEAITWAIDADGALVIEPEFGLSETVTGGNILRIDNELTQLSYVRINEGQLADTLVERATYRQDSFNADGDLLNSITRDVYQAFTAVKPAGRLSWTNEQVVGRWAMPGVNRRSNPNVNAHMAQDGIMTFNVDGTGESEEGDLFNWQILSNGELEVTFADASVHSYVLIRDAEPEFEVLAIGMDLDTGTSGAFANGGLAVKIDEMLVIADEDLHKRFLMYGDDQLFNMDQTANFENPLVFEIYEDGPMTVFVRDGDGDLAEPALMFGRYRWNRVGNGLFAERLYDTGFGAENWECVPGMFDCNPVSDIQWEFLRLEGDRLYVREWTRYYDYPEDVQTTRYRQSLIKWWEIDEHLEFP